MAAAVRQRPAAHRGRRGQKRPRLNGLDRGQGERDASRSNAVLNTSQNLTNTKGPSRWGLSPPAEALHVVLIRTSAVPRPCVLTAASLTAGPHLQLKLYCLSPSPDRQVRSSKSRCNRMSAPAFGHELPQTVVVFSGPRSN
jgi:hypothetical protein